jgi:hypothetical protein
VLGFCVVKEENGEGSAGCVVHYKIDIFVLGHGIYMLRGLIPSMLHIARVRW